MTHPIRSTIVTIGSFSLLVGINAVLPGWFSPSVACADPPPTEIEEVVMYGIDADTHQLLRYSFDAAEYRVVGTITDPGGNTVEDFESLAYVRTGPHRGVYTSPQQGPYAHHLMRLSLLNATVTIYPADIGHDEVLGMLAVEDPVTFEWSIHATTRSNNLISIDLTTGTGTVIAALGRAYDGLAAGPDGTLYAIFNTELWAIDPSSGSETLLGSQPYGDLEALEYAFGDNDPGVTVPGVPAAWTADGILFGFSDDGDTLVILDPLTGNAMSWPTPLVTPDCEGLIFVTRTTDPVYYVIYAPFD